VLAMLECWYNAVITLNLGSYLAVARSKCITKKEIPYFIAEGMLHEIVHVLEDWAKVKFDHRKVNALMRKYENLTRGKRR
jgi:hypothetical protein